MAGYWALAARRAASKARLLHAAAVPVKPSSPLLDAAAVPVKPSSPLLDAAAVPVKPATPLLHAAAVPVKPATPLLHAAASTARPATLQPAPPLLHAGSSDRHLFGRVHGLTHLLAGGTAKHAPAILPGRLPFNAASKSLLGAHIRNHRIANLSPRTGGSIFGLQRSSLLSARNSAPPGLGRRGLSSRASFSPELMAELQKMEAADLKRYQEALDAFAVFRASTRKAFALHEVQKLNKSVENARIGWRTLWGTLAFGALGMYYALHLKSMWFVEFKKRGLFLLTELVHDLIEELEICVKEVVNEELHLQSVRSPDLPVDTRVSLAGAPVTVDLMELLNDSDLMASFGDPEVLHALQDVMQNPGNISNYKSDPKVGPVIAKVMAKFNGGV